MVNLQGFRDLVDAVGGVKLNVRSRIPVGGLGTNVTGYIEPGVKTLNGHDTLWFARAREGSDDYSRMARQKCVMSAMLRQISPQTALSNFQDIAAASSEMVSTNLPAKELDRFMGLALKAKDQKISTVSLVPPAIVTAAPDIALVHQMIADAITRAEGGTPAADTAQAAPAPAESGAARRRLPSRPPSRRSRRAPRRSPAAPSAASPTGTPPTRPRTSLPPAEREHRVQPQDG